MPVSAENSAQIVALVQDGRSMRYVARFFGVSLSTVQRVIKRFSDTGRNTRRPGSGRRRKTTAREDRSLHLYTLRNRQTTALQVRNQLLEAGGPEISVWTVRRRLNEAGLRSYRPAHGPKLLPRHRIARLRFAQNHILWTAQQWGTVLFTDESRFCLHSPDGRERVYRRTGERFAPCTFTPRFSHGGGSVMVWAGITAEARTELVFVENGSITADRYIRDILADHVVPFAPFIGQNFILMQDNARPHTAICVLEYLDTVGIQRLNWPACSPDANPIEHVWDMLGRLIRKRAVAPRSLEGLREALREEWDNIPQDYIRGLIEGMNRRLRAIIRARGGNTHY